jgi:hypothetical protein
MRGRKRCETAAFRPIASGRSLSPPLQARRCSSEMPGPPSPSGAESREPKLRLPMTKPWAEGGRHHPRLRTSTGAISSKQRRDSFRTAVALRQPGYRSRQFRWLGIRLSRYNRKGTESRSRPENLFFRTADLARARSPAGRCDRGTGQTGAAARAVLGDKAFLDKACRQIRCAGTSRRRGGGKSGPDIGPLCRHPLFGQASRLGGKIGRCGGVAAGTGSRSGGRQRTRIEALRRSRPRQQTCCRDESAGHEKRNARSLEDSR